MERAAHRDYIIVSWTLDTSNCLRMPERSYVWWHGWRHGCAADRAMDLAMDCCSIIAPFRLRTHCVCACFVCCGTEHARLGCAPPRHYTTRVLGLRQEGGVILSLCHGATATTWEVFMGEGFRDRVPRRAMDCLTHIARQEGVSK